MRSSRVTHLRAERTRLVRFEHNGALTVLAEQANGKPLNGPNDMVVHPNDKSIWFTDPGYGAISIYEGQRANTGSTQPYQKEAVYRLDAQSGQVSKVADEPFKPNGIAFSHDYKKVYVCDTGITHYPNAKNIVWQYDLNNDKLSNPRTLIDMTLDGKSGFPDGCGSTSMATSGSAPVGSATATMASRCSRPIARASVRSVCPRPAPMSASAARNETACS